MQPFVYLTDKQRRPGAAYRGAERRGRKETRPSVKRWINPGGALVNRKGEVEEKQDDYEIERNKPRRRLSSRPESSIRPVGPSRAVRTEVAQLRVSSLKNE